MIALEEGVIVDSPEGATGGDGRSATWMVLLHRVGWSAQAGSPFRASRWHWLGNTSVAFSLAGRAPDNLPKVPLHRFYSVLGDSRQSAADVCWASAWAIDRLLDSVAPR